MITLNAVIMANRYQFNRRNKLNALVDMSGVEEKGFGLCNLNVTGLRPTLATRHNYTLCDVGQ